MRKLDFDVVLGEEKSFASFHDAVIHSLNIDYEARVLQMDCTLYTGNPDAESHADREATSGGTLSFTGLLYCVIEPPDATYDFEQGGLDISADGDVATTQFKSPIPKLPEVNEPNAFAHWLYATNWNAFVFVAATGAHFVWK